MSLPLFPFVRGDRGAARNFFTVSSDIPFHPPLLYIVFFFHLFSSPVFFTSLLTQSSHISPGLPRLAFKLSKEGSNHWNTGDMAG